MNPEGLSAAYGKHAQAIADRLARADLSCKVLEWVPFQRAMLEKLIWISAFMLVGAKYSCTVGEVRGLTECSADLMNRSSDWEGSGGEEREEKGLGGKGTEGRGNGRGEEGKDSEGRGGGGSEGREGKWRGGGGGVRGKGMGGQRAS